MHHRDSVSLAALSEKEIQQRIKLGLVTSNPNDPGLTEGDEEEEEVDLEDEWEDFDSDDDNEDGSKSGSHSKKAEYILTSSRRTSVDLSSMASNSHDETDWESDNHSTASDFEPNKRHRSRSVLLETGIGTIQEETAEEEEVATVNGEDDEAMES